MTTRTALVTGATGYVGGLVVEKLLEDGWNVRTLSRSPEKLKAHAWHDRVEAVAGDATIARHKAIRGTRISVSTAKKCSLARGMNGDHCQFALSERWRGSSFR